MNGLFFLLCCTLIALSCGAPIIQPTGDENNSSLPATTSLTAQTNDSKSVTEASAAMSSAGPTNKVTSTTTSRPPVTQPSLFQNMSNKGCLPLLMVIGGLMLVCTILLVSSLLLACKVCHLARRLKGLGSNSDLISDTEKWTGPDKNGKSRSGAEAKETTVLMADMNETPAETREEGGKVTEEGQKGEESKEGAGGAVGGEEASAKPAADADKSSPTEPRGEAADSETTEAATAPTSEGTEEPKDVV